MARAPRAHIERLSMRREGRVRGKPTNKSRVTGRCRSGKTRCRSCRDHPVEKSRPKRMGRYKRFAVDVSTNPALDDFVLEPSLRHLDEERLWADAELRNMNFEGEDETEAMAATVYEMTSGAEILAGDATDIADIELAFQKQLGIFENAVEGDSFSEFANEGWETLSEESWSDVELAEPVDMEISFAEDDWSIVDVAEVAEDAVRE